MAMAIHRQLRKAARLSLQAYRRGREALKRRRARRGLAQHAEPTRLDERFRSLAVHVLAGNYYECPWEMFRLGHFKGMDDKEAARELFAWARVHRINILFEVRRVRDVDVVYLLLKSAAH